MQDCWLPLLKINCAILEAELSVKRISTFAQCNSASELQGAIRVVLDRSGLARVQVRHKTLAKGPLKLQVLPKPVPGGFVAGDLGGFECPIGQRLTSLHAPER